MTILHIAALVALAVVIGQLARGRQLALLAVSAAVVFWLQPAAPIPAMGFWLPAATVGITVLSWALTSAPESRSWEQTWPAAAVLATVVLLAALNRYGSPTINAALTAPRVGYAVALVLGVGACAWLLARQGRARPVLLAGLLIGILLIFIVIKTPAAADEAVNWLQTLRRHAANAEGATSLAWLGFSYVAFRLIHTIRDRQSGRLPAVTLAEYANFVMFFPAFAAGPIDRVERFLRDLRSPIVLHNDDWLEAGSRLILGLFKKFVIAELLGVISISDLLVLHVKSAGWLWLFLYAYGLRIYFDFSGYTDVAVGMGRLLGVRLPENFAAPYVKPNIAQFWNSWHMSLTQWFRAYVFNPTTRTLQSASRPAPAWLIILSTQVLTMVLIGLWHGIAWSFAAWGLWHALGLFIHNRWTSLVRTRMPAWMQAPRSQVPIRALGVLLTFNFVSIGWLFFGLSTPSLAWQALLTLFGGA